MFCTHCGAQLEDGARFCTECGAELGAREQLEAARPRFCTECGAELVADALHCVACGAAVGAMGVEPEPATQAFPVAASAVGSETFSLQEAPAAAPKPASHKTALIAAGCAVAAVAVAVGLFVLMDPLGMRRASGADSGDEAASITEAGSGGASSESADSVFGVPDGENGSSAADESEETTEPEGTAEPSSDELFEALGVTTSIQSSMCHGAKATANQKYIVLHETGIQGSPQDSASNLAGQGGSGMHFIIGRDGGILQCVPLDQIAHHAGAGDVGNNALYGVEISGDDTVGTSSYDLTQADYGMNSYSIGIQLMHTSGEEYSEGQLQALDGLVAYIDAYYAEQGVAEKSAIIDHKAWRTGCEDMSAEFSSYLAAYQDHRTHESV